MTERAVMGMTNRGHLVCPYCAAVYKDRIAGTDWIADETTQDADVMVTCGECSTTFKWWPNTNTTEKLDG